MVPQKKVVKHCYTFSLLFYLWRVIVNSTHAGKQTWQWAIHINLLASDFGIEHAGSAIVKLLSWSATLSGGQKTWLDYSWTSKCNHVESGTRDIYHTQVWFWQKSWFVSSKPKKGFTANVALKPFLEKMPPWNCWMQHLSNGFVAAIINLLLICVYYW